MDRCTACSPMTDGGCSSLTRSTAATTLTTCPRPVRPCGRRSPRVIAPPPGRSFVNRSPSWPDNTRCRPDDCPADARLVHPAVVDPAGERRVLPAHGHLLPADVQPVRIPAVHPSAPGCGAGAVRHLAPLGLLDRLRADDLDD